MKKLLVLVLPVLLLTGCSRGERQIGRAMDLRRQLLEAAEVSFTAQIRADCGSECQSFTLYSECDDLGNLGFLVREPESISGIRGRVRASGGQLTFDGTALAFPLLAQGTLSPVSAPWVLLKTLRSGHLLSAGEEGELLRLDLAESYEENALRVTVWLQPDNTPSAAELVFGGETVLSMTISDFSVERKPDAA